MSTARVRTGVDSDPQTPEVIPVAQPWMRRAACRNDPDPDAWFASDAHGRTNWARHLYALNTCKASCPVRLACLEFALSQNTYPVEMAGVWGGMSQRQRRALRRAPQPIQRQEPA